MNSPENVQLVLVTHGSIGQLMIDQARILLGKLPLPTFGCSIFADDDPEDIIRHLSATTDNGRGVLILTDLCGSTPANIANQIAAQWQCPIVYGLNLAMLLRAYNYPEQGALELAGTVVEGGRRAIFAGDRGS